MVKKLLLYSRYLLLVPVIGCLLLTVSLVVMGFGLIVVRGVELLQSAELSMKVAKSYSVSVLFTMELFLVGAIAYITAVGIYSLFVNQEDEQPLMRLKIETLDDLKDKILGVVVAALAIAFLSEVAEAVDMIKILQLGVGIALTIAAMALYKWLSHLN